MTDTYDDSDEIRGSPGLEISTVNYGPKEATPPPFANQNSEEDAPKPWADEGTSPGGSRKRLLKPSNPKPETSRGNSVLISYLEPNRPDIALDASSFPLSEEDTRGDDFDRILVGKPKPVPVPDDEPSKPRPDLNEAAKYALQLLHGNLDSISNPPKDTSPKRLLSEPPIKAEPGTSNVPLSQSQLQPQPQPPPSSYASNNPSPEKLESKSVSPLSKFVIPASEGSAQDLLPALHSPDNPHTLPSLQTALSGIPTVPKEQSASRINTSSPYCLPPVTATSPPVPKFGPPQVPPSPYSHWSPASTSGKEHSAVSSPASQNAYWRPLKSDISYLTSTYEISHSAAKSPATSYPTPTDQTPGTCERTPYNPTPPSGAVSTGTYKCHHHGCTAPPFQTQYLLNSHANVHSQDRPHFCPVEGCPRGLGGRGFKRKNEMIRHGLVHNSPGYVCPFCPDQQHKYPRPDNLQRHVRVHHVDKSKDDPLLRQVLSQRPEGSVRGRRRRTSVQ